MKLTAYWDGTDSLLLRMWMGGPVRKILYQIYHRLRAKIIDRLVDQHFAVSPEIKANLLQAGMKKPIIHEFNSVRYHFRLPEKKHSVFTVLYYYPGDREWPLLWRWVYGKDIYDQVKTDLSRHSIRWLEVDGTADMSEVYPQIDYLLRCNRSDGDSRMVRECEIQGIPYYWSTSDPDIEEIKRKILYYQELFNYNQGTEHEQKRHLAVD